MADRLPTDEELARLQRTTVLYDLHATNPDNGLVRDKTDPDAPSSIAAAGLALATIPAVVERGVLIRKFAAKSARRRLQSLVTLPQGPEPDAAGEQGVLLSLPRHRHWPSRWNCELSTLDSAFRCGSSYLCHLLRCRHGGRGRRSTPRRHALPPCRLGLGVQWRADTATAGSQRPASCRIAMKGMTRGSCSTCWPSARRPTRFRRRVTTRTAPPISGRKSTDRELLYSGPLFTHQLSHLWIDFRGIRDAFMRERGSDDFENSRQATLVQQEVGHPEPAGLRGVREALLGHHGL